MIRPSEFAPDALNIVHETVHGTVNRRGTVDWTERSSINPVDARKTLTVTTSDEAAGIRAKLSRFSNVKPDVALVRENVARDPHRSTEHRVEEKRPLR